MLSTWCILGAPGAEAETWRITPSASARGTYTDNVDLAPNDAKQSSFVLELAPALRIDGTGRRLKLHLDYQLDGVIDTRDSSRSEVRNLLALIGTAEVLEDFFFIDFSGNISQQVLSPFGPRPVSSANFSDNRVETRAYQVSPYVRGRLPGAEYTVRFTESGLRTDQGLDSSQVHQFLARISGDSSFRRVNWVLEATSEKADFHEGRNLRDDWLRGTLVYVATPELRLSAFAGAERNNFITLSQVTHSTYGAAVDWAPTERTAAHARWEHRFFGSAWDYGIRHRTPRLAFTFADARDVTTDAQRLGSISSGVAYDLVFNALTTRFPDPAERAIEAQRILQTGGIPPDLGVPVDFLVGGAFVNRQQNASIALLGVRNSAVLTVYRSNRRQLQPEGIVLDLGFSTAAITEYGSSIALSHQLTSLSSVTALASWRRTSGDNPTGEGEAASRQWDARLLYSTQFGPRTSGTLELRHVQFYGAGGLGDYSANAAVASVQFRF